MAVFRYRKICLPVLFIFSVTVVIVEIVFVSNENSSFDEDFVPENEQYVENPAVFNLDENWHVNYSEGKCTY